MGFSKNMVGPVILTTSATSAAGSGSANTLTLAAAAGLQNVVGQVSWSYSAAPTSGSLCIDSPSGSRVFTERITAAGPGVFSFYPPIASDINTAMVISLSSGSTGILGTINATAWTE